MQLLEKVNPQHTYFNTDVAELDITDQTAIETFVNENKIDGIVNCAAYTAVDKAESDADFARALNAEGPKNIARLAKKLGCPAGVAHTDLFGHAERLGIAPLDYFSRMAEENIFWEMNVSYDSIHGYYEHPYMLDFFADPEKQETVRRSGVRLSVGFDGHRVEDYLPGRIKDYCGRITAMGIPLAFEKTAS